MAFLRGSLKARHVQAANPASPRVDAPHVDIHLVRTFPFPVDAAYGWLTDYHDDDATLTDAVVKRRSVVRREGDEVELDAELVTLGRPMRGRAVVKLDPARHRWVATAAGGRLRYEYQLTPTPEGHSRLDVHYRVASRRWARRLLLVLARPRIRRELHRMWDGFEAAMRRELGAARRESP